MGVIQRPSLRPTLPAVRACTTQSGLCWCTCMLCATWSRPAGSQMASDEASPWRAGRAGARARGAVCTEEEAMLCMCRQCLVKGEGRSMAPWRRICLRWLALGERADEAGPRHAQAAATQFTRGATVQKQCGEASSAPGHDSCNMRCAHDGSRMRVCVRHNNQAPLSISVVACSGAVTRVTL
jgi:hypothetical protein